MALAPIALLALIAAASDVSAPVDPCALPDLKATKLIVDEQVAHKPPTQGLALIRACPSNKAALWVMAEPSVLQPAWDDAVESHPNDAAAITNAAEFFSRVDGSEQKSIALYERARKLDPTATMLLIREGDVVRRTHTAEDARRALALFDAAPESKEQHSFGSNRVLHSMAVAAYESGDVARAKELAVAAIGCNCMPANLSRAQSGIDDTNHAAHTLLGLIALKGNDVATAKAELAKAGSVQPSVVMGVDGPNMELARQLLALGEKKAVLDYIATAKHYWRPVKQWTREIKADRTPDFGKSLTAGL